MSNTRSLLSLVVATAVGVLTGITIFNPAFKDLQQEKKQKQSLSDLQTSGMENADPTSTDSTSTTLPPSALRPVGDLDNVKSDAQK
ncbi:hypothetical protein MMC22_000538 [Lobaria immixta]|nr:hypothetical protein [Lobaria immixta]